MQGYYIGGVHIGDGTMIGAGSIVLYDTPINSTIVGLYKNNRT